MTRPILLLFGVAMAAVLLAQSAAPVAHACSVIPLTMQERVTQEEVIVEGQFVSWEPAPTFEVSASWRNLPIRLRFVVLRTLKGAEPERVDIIDIWSVRVENGTYSWGVSPTSCPSPFTEDPTGKFAILGIQRPGEPGTSQFYVGASLSGDSYNSVLSSMIASLPSGGGPPLASDSRDQPLLPVVAPGVAISVASLLAAAFVWRRRARL